MQFNGIGNGHDAEMHHVTNCMHEHTHFKKEIDDTGSGGSGMKSYQSMEAASHQEEGQYSLSAWVEKLLGNGKRFLRGIWNGSESVPGQEGTGGTRETAGDRGVRQTESRDAGNPAALNASQAAAASQAAPPLPRMIEDNPYFSAIGDSKGREKDIWQKMRIKFRDVKGQLTGHLPGKFFHAQTKNSFQSKKEQPKEDLRKHSRFHGDEVEIDCILTEDSYLMDSYDRNGAYSKLSAKK